MAAASSSKIYLTILCFVIGLLVVMQLRAQSRLTPTLQAQSNVEQAQVISNLLDSNEQLRREIGTLRDKLGEYEEANGRSDLDVLVRDLNRLKMFNGLAEISGPGVEVSIGGTLAVTDMQDIVNELRNAGAEGISLNNHRLSAKSVVAADGSGLAVDGQRLRSPYLLQAIGQPETLERALERKGGLLSLMRYNNPQLQITVTKRSDLTLPVYEGSYDFKYAKPAAQ